MPDSFLQPDFDDWAETYDEAVTGQDFPFCGYQEVLEKVAALVMPQAHLSVLDIGTGTGNLALLLDRLGCELWCTDFSASMLEKARQKLPASHFILHDLHDPLPLAADHTFDRIVSSYTFHHFMLEEKVSLLCTLFARHLSPHGLIVIGDISFQDTSGMEKLRREAGNSWDDEFYWIADEVIPVLRKRGIGVEYVQVSPCAGVFKLRSHTPLKAIHVQE